MNTEIFMTEGRGKSKGSSPRAPFYLQTNVPAGVSWGHGVSNKDLDHFFFQKTERGLTSNK